MPDADPDFKELDVETINKQQPAWQCSCGWIGYPDRATCPQCRKSRQWRRVFSREAALDMNVFAAKHALSKNERLVAALARIYHEIEIIKACRENIDWERERALRARADTILWVLAESRDVPLDLT